MRTRARRPAATSGNRARPRLKAIAAEIASDASPNAAKTPSPSCLTTTPPAAATVSSTSWSWSARRASQASASSSCARRVELSMSEKKKVTAGPVGSVLMPAVTRPSDRPPGDAPGPARAVSTVEFEEHVTLTRQRRRPDADMSVSVDRPAGRVPSQENGMPLEAAAPRSRRALLAAAAGTAAAFAAQAALPLTAGAADGDPVLQGTPNATTADTSITDSGAGSTAVAGNARGTGAGYGVLGTSTGGGGIVGWSISPPDVAWFTPDLTSYTGVFGSAPSHPNPDIFATGVWGDSPDVGVYGSGS